MFIHNPVMVAQVLSYLSIESDDIVVDCTLGEGGHSSHFLQKVNKGTVLGIEQDAGILESAVSRLKEHRDTFIPVRDNFSNLKIILSGKIGKKRDTTPIMVTSFAFLLKGYDWLCFYLQQNSIFCFINGSIYPQF